jgi:hypothetical protein
LCADEDNATMTKLFFFKSTLAIFSMAILFPLTAGGVKAQGSVDFIENPVNTAEYNNLVIRNISTFNPGALNSKIEDLNVEPLSMVEKHMAESLNSHWAWRENTLAMIDSFSPFLFRTKKSRSIDEVKMLLQVSAKGKLTGFEIVGEVDKGLRERIDHMLRKLPDCKPVPGFSNYSPVLFELVIRK